MTLPIRILTLVLSTLPLILVPMDASAELLVLPRAGLTLTGSGSMDISCEEAGAYAGTCTNSDTDSFDDNSGFALGLDVMTTLDALPNVVVGGGLLFQTSHTISAVTLLGKPLETLGTDLSTYALVEYNTPISKTLRILARGQGGLFALFTGSGDDLGKRNEDFGVLCNNFGNNTTCEVDESPYFGWSAGISVGAVLDVDGQFGLRAEILAEYFNVDIAGYDIASGSDSVKTEVDYSNTRILLLVGLELGREPTKKRRSRFGPSGNQN